MNIQKIAELTKAWENETSRNQSFQKIRGRKTFKSVFF